jgi:hypothetical protein
VPDTTPAETLRKAAALMRGRAEALANDDWPALPWAVTECSDKEAGECPCIVYQGEYGPYTEPQAPPIQYVCDAESAGFAEWIASMHPILGIALAGLLETTALCGCEEDDDHWPQKSAALAFARLFLGEVSGA